MDDNNSVIVDKQESTEKKPRIKNKRKAAIVVAVVAVVLIASGLGFNAWHTTPGFCDAICHNPQDPYNPTYYAEPGQPAVDKWGNQVADATGMLAAVHRADANSNCLSCHEPTMQEQVVEGMEWASGNFYNPLSERSLANLTRWHNGKEPTSFCLNESCHNLTMDELTEKKADLARNPHSWHHTEYTCNDCHKSHRASVMVCTQCHDDAQVPTGWLDWQQSMELDTRYLSYDQEQMVTAN